MPGGKVPDEAGPVQGHVATLGAGEGNLLGQQRRHLVLQRNIMNTGPLNNQSMRPINRVGCC